MKQAFKSAIRQTLKQFDIGITTYSRLQKFIASSQASDDLEFLSRMPESHLPTLLKYLKQSTSQLRQDLFVLSELGFKRGGYFVEFGATNGIKLSNTYLLEKEFDWNGILAEPAKCWHAGLKRNRKVPFETECVWSQTGSTVNFNEVADPELSTVSDFSSGDYHRSYRKNGKIYAVRTISLLDLLIKHQAPSAIDYLSIDTEGSEFSILSAFDFSRYSFNVITCEHNHTPSREKIYALLSSHGYKRKYEEISKFDDWYVKG